MNRGRRRYHINQRKKKSRQPIVNLLDFQLHKHILHCGMRKNINFREILIKDNLEDFKQIYDINPNNIKLKFYFRCYNKGQKKCKDFNILSGILLYNSNDIAKYVLNKDKKISIYELDIMIQIMKRKKNNYDSIKKFFLNSFIYTDLNDKEMNCLFEKIFALDDWDLIDFFHIYGYKINNIEKFIINIPNNKINNLKELGYVFNDKIFLKILLNNKTDMKTLYDIEFNDNIINNTLYSKKIMNIFKKNSLDKIKFIYEKGFNINQKCFDMAISGFNFPAIFYILDKQNFLNEKYLHKMIFNSRS